jgi:hypothetical protein
MPMLSDQVSRKGSLRSRVAARISSATLGWRTIRWQCPQEWTLPAFRRLTSRTSPSNSTVSLQKKVRHDELEIRRDEIWELGAPSATRPDGPLRSLFLACFDCASRRQAVDVIGPILHHLLALVMLAGRTIRRQCPQACPLPAFRRLTSRTSPSNSTVSLQKKVRHDELNFFATKFESQDHQLQPDRRGHLNHCPWFALIVLREDKLSI